MTLTAPKVVYGVHSLTLYDRTNWLPYGILKVVGSLAFNLSGDFNDAYRDHDVEKQRVDVHLSGQPPLIYRGEIAAKPGEKTVPALYGQSALDSSAGQTVRPVSAGVTTAKNMFKTIEIRVVLAGQNRV